MALDDGGGHLENRLVLEEDLTLGDRMDVAGETELAQVLKEALGKPAAGRERVDVRRVKVEILQKIEDPLEARTDEIAAVRGIFPDKQAEGGVVKPSMIEVGRGHGKLVLVGEQGRVEGVRGHIASFAGDWR